MSTDWYVYRGEEAASTEEAIAAWLRSPPPWRRTALPVDGPVASPEPLKDDTRRRAESYVSTTPEEVLRVNMALRLRRPLLVTGRPGIGKTSLGYSIAGRLGLGAPLRWNIGSQSTLRDGLYSYDAVAHLGAQRESGRGEGAVSSGIDEFITLGPLGSALLPSDRPRMLIVDEIDKANFDLAHDLLHVFEEGAFDIPELARLDRAASVHANAASGERIRVPVTGGSVVTRHHPVVVITSNGERDFPEAFRRRCVELTLEKPPVEKLKAIVERQLGGAVPAALFDEVARGLEDQSTDVLLQTLFLRQAGASSAEVEGLRRHPERR